MTTAQRERTLDQLDAYPDAELVDHALNCGADVDAMQREWLTDKDAFRDAFRETSSCDWPRIAGEQHEAFIKWAAAELREKYTRDGSVPWLSDGE